VGVRRPHHDAVRQPGKLDVVGVAAAAADQPWILETRHALADGEFTHGRLDLLNTSATGPVAGEGMCALLASTCLELLRHPRREICEHAIAAGALEGEKAFNHRAVGVRP